MNSLRDIYDRDGVVLIRKALAENWLHMLDQAVDDIMADPSGLSREYAPTGEGRFFTDHHMSHRNPDFRSFMQDSPVVGIVADLLGAQRLYQVDEHLLVKEPGTCIPTRWHHDLPYYHVDGESFVSMWIPLDPVSADTGAMKFVRGSHLWGKVFRPIRIGTGEAAENAEDYDGDAPNIDSHPEEYDIALFEMNRGDVLCFHAATLHAANPNQSAVMRRRALSLRYASEQARIQPRAYVPSDSAGKKTAKPIDSGDFPQVWGEPDKSA